MKLLVEGILEPGEIPEINHIIKKNELKPSLLFFTSHVNYDINVNDKFDSFYPEEDSSSVLKGTFTVIALTNQLSVSLSTLERGYYGICQIMFDNKILFEKVKEMVPVVKNWYEFEERFVFEQDD